MGYGMAVNLRSKMDPSATLLICDVNKSALEKFQTQMEEKGEIKVVENAFEAAKAADIVITMLPGPVQVEEVYLDPKTGIIAGAKGSTGKLFMECGTIDADVIIKVGKAVKESGVGYFVDAPVSGGPAGANDGTLTFMVGADEEAAFERAKSVLKYMGKEKNIYLCGDIGAGSAFKVLNNYLSAIISIASSETLNIGVKMGLDPKKLTDVIQASGGQNWILEYANPCPGVKPGVSSSRKYEGGFRVELCTKVFKMGVKLAEMVGAKTVLSTATKESFEAVCADPRFKGKDARVVYKWLADEPVE